MANCSLLIHPITSLPPNREPTEGWPWLSSWTVSITWPRPFRGGPHGDSWPFFPHFFSDFWAGKFDCLNITRKLEVSLYGLSLINVATCFFQEWCFFFKSLCCFDCLLHFKGYSYHLPGPGYPIPLLVTSETLGGHLWYTSIRYVLFWSRCDLTKFGDYEIRALIGSLVGWLVDVCNYILVDIGWGSKKMELA